MKTSVLIEIPFKLWMLAEADKLGITKHSLETRLHRGKYRVPHPVKRGRRGRAIAVLLRTDKIPAIS